MPWNVFPGQQPTQGYPPFPGAPPQTRSPPFGFPSPNMPPYGEGSPNYGPGYAPSYGTPGGYPPPQGSPWGGPPGGPQPGGGFAPPPGPSPGYGPGGPPLIPPPGYGPGGPPPIPPRPDSGYQNQYMLPPGPPNQYAPPPGPPNQYAPPPGPPNQYAPPPGPPQQHYDRREYQPPPGRPMLPPNQTQRYGPSFEGQDHQQHQLQFKYSNCSGKKKALCIGINYTGQSAALAGCINDANNVSRFLQELWGYKEEDIVILMDDNRDPRKIPTKQNIINAMNRLVQDARPDDSLFFHYSGHGGQTKDVDGDEADGYDEVIYPLDFEQAGHIVDDEMHAIMVRQLPQGCRLTAIFDSCHSGSALDLPYIYSTEGKIKEPNLAAEAGQGLLSAVTSYARGDMGGVMTSVSGLLKYATGGGQRADKKARETKTSPADVISWSGCKDSQTSADTQEAGQATGAMSYAFMEALRRRPQQSYQELLVNIRAILKEKYSQKPQLSSSHPIDVNYLFVC